MDSVPAAQGDLNPQFALLWCLPLSQLKLAQHSKELPSRGRRGQGQEVHMLFVFKKDAPTLAKGKTQVRIVTYNESPQHLVQWSLPLWCDWPVPTVRAPLKIERCSPGNVLLSWPHLEQLAKARPFCVSHPSHVPFCTRYPVSRGRCRDYSDSLFLSA